MSTELPTEPRPDFLQRAEIDSYRKSAEQSQEWKDKLENPTPLKKFGRWLLNSVGVQSPEQKAIPYHDGIIQNYAESLGMESSGVMAMPDEEYVKAREAAIERGVKDGRIVIQDEPNTEIVRVNFTPTSGVRQLGVKHKTS